MKREEKAKNSRERIINAAMEEFASNHYDSISINNICQKHEISKGLIYHYFDNKDKLYLECVRISYRKLTDFLDGITYHFSDVKKGLMQYIERRIQFFREYPWEGRLFFYTIFQKPVHLEVQLKEITEEFERQCLQYYKEILKHVKLREGISEKEALDYFVLMQEFFNGYFEKNIKSETEIEMLAQNHETKLFTMLEWMIYGIAKEEE